MISQCTYFFLRVFDIDVCLFLLQLAELEARLLEAESRADEAEDKVSAKNVYFFPHNPLVFFLCAVNIWCVMLKSVWRRIIFS